MTHFVAKIRNFCVSFASKPTHANKILGIAAKNKTSVLHAAGPHCKKAIISTKRMNFPSVTPS
jgi:hypothetical protein